MGRRENGVRLFSSVGCAVRGFGVLLVYGSSCLWCGGAFLKFALSIDPFFITVTVVHALYGNAL